MRHPKQSPSEALTAERVRERLDYDSETGVFTWKVGRRGMIGSVAGCPNTIGYWQIMIDNKNYTAHRLAFLYMTGEWPREMVDHINRDRSDNRFANLRLADPTQNALNQSLRSDNKTGVRGVSFSKKDRAYIAQIPINGKKVCLGRFRTIAEARAAYLSVAMKVFDLRFFSERPSDTEERDEKAA